jgi:hypothetical protein
MWRIRAKGRSAMLSRKLVLGVGAKRWWLPFVGNYRTFLYSFFVEHVELFAVFAALGAFPMDQ